MKYPWNLRRLLLLLIASLPQILCATKPNVLLIIADDLRDTLGCYGNVQAKTPHIDRLAGRAVRFENAFAQYPVCNPSRSSLMLGMRCEQTGIVDNGEFFRERWPDAVTLPQLLRQGGWATQSFGKIFHTANTGENQRAAWLDLGKSWDSASPINPTTRGAKGEYRKLAGGKITWCEIGIIDDPESEQPDAITASAAIRAMRELSAAKQPWMIAAGFHRPHDPFHAPRKYFELYPKEKLKLSEKPADQTAMPPLAITGAWVAEFAQFSDDDKRSFLQAYLAGVSFMDAQVGRLLEELDALKLTENTLIIFLGDHGYHLGEREWWNKSTLFDRSCRAPLLIAAPNATKGKSFASPVEFVDIYPTVADYCGLAHPHPLAGKSLRPVLQDTSCEHKEAAFTLVTRGEHRFGQSVRTQRWRYTQWSDGTSELYDHNSDPEENHDLAKDPQQQNIVSAMKKRLAALPSWPQKPSKR